MGEKFLLVFGWVDDTRDERFCKPLVSRASYAVSFTVIDEYTRNAGFCTPYRVNTAPTHKRWIFVQERGAQISPANPGDDMLLQRGLLAVAFVFQIGQARQTWQHLNRSVANKTAIVRLTKRASGRNLLRLHRDKNRVDWKRTRSFGARSCDVEQRGKRRDTKGASNDGQYTRNSRNTFFHGLNISAVF